MKNDVTAPMGSATLAGNILLAIFENLRSQSNRRQLFFKVTCIDLHEIFYQVLISHGQYWTGDYFQFEYLKNLFVFSDSPRTHNSPVLQKAIEQLQLAGMICWPDCQERDVMRLNPSASDYYELRLLPNTEDRLAYQDVISAQKIAKMIYTHWQELVVQRHHLMNLPS